MVKRNSSAPENIDGKTILGEGTHIAVELTEARIEHSQELIDVTPSDEPDPTWRYTDKAGHEHRYEPDGAPEDPYNHYPTLEEEVEDRWCPECGHYEQMARLVCYECGEEISPGTRTPIAREFTAGPKQARLTGRIVDYDYIVESLPQAQGTIAGALDGEAGEWRVVGVGAEPGMVGYEFEFVFIPGAREVSNG